MPATVNGVGTSVCDARGHVSWGGPCDCDAVECLVILFMPILPIKAVHTYQWDGVNYQQVPIVWSWGLVLRAFARRWLLALAFAAVVVVIGAFSTRPEYLQAALLVSALTLIVFMVLGYWLLWVTDQRTIHLRRVLGPHDLGSSDPATWRSELLSILGKPRDLYDTETYGEAVPMLLEDRRYGSAMMAARLTVALEERAYGEQLTDMILHDAEVQEALEVVRRDPRQWARIMEAGTPGNPPLPPQVSTTDITS